MLNHKKLPRPILRRPIDWVCAIAVVVIFVVGLTLLAGCQWVVPQAPGTPGGPNPCTYSINGVCYYDPAHLCPGTPGFAGGFSLWRLVYYGGHTIYVCGPPNG